MGLKALLPTAGWQMNAGGSVLVVPCYNEADRFKADEFRAFVIQQPATSLLFVDDGSTDGTLAILKRLQAEVPRIDVLHLTRNSGKGEAVRQGLLQALKTSGIAYVGFWDADLATPLEAVGDLLEVLQDQPQIEMVFGSRVKLLGRQIERRPARHYLGRVFATCASLVLNLPIYDTQCGAKLFRATADLQAVLQQPFLSRWIFDVELIARFQQLHAAGEGWSALRERIYEFPLHCWRDIPGSKVGPGDFLTAIRDLVIIRRRYKRQ